MKEVKIGLAIPAISGLPPTMVGGLLDLVAAQMIYRYAIIEGTLLPWARNACINMFYENEVDFTHILFIDADMVGFKPIGLHALVEADKDIISGVCTMRRPPYDVSCSPIDKSNFNQHLLDGDLIQCNWTGMAFTLIKREVLDALAEETPDGLSWFNLDREPREGFFKEVSSFVLTNKDRSDTGQLLTEAIMMGQTCHIGSRVFGEDINFCKWAVRSGFSVWMHCGVVVGHMGEHIYNLKDAIRHAQENKLQENQQENVQLGNDELFNPRLRVVN
jgi:hypothetical protein